MGVVNFCVGLLRRLHLGFDLVADDHRPTQISQTLQRKPKTSVLQKENFSLLLDEASRLE